VLNALESAIAEVAESDARTLIITGEGRAFVAGADIGAMAGLTPSEAEAFARRGQSVLDGLEALPCPVIAAVNGFALGGGCELALACDLIVASDKARFGQPEVKLGVIPGFGGTQRMLRKVGWARGAELIYTGRMIDAREAAAIGLALRVVPADELMDTCRQLADAIGAVGPLAVAAAKRALRQGGDLPLADALALEAQAFGALFESEDQGEGMAAFLEKRKADFVGR
jgi:enoyl-CoA hydratase